MTVGAGPCRACGNRVVSHGWHRGMGLPGLWLNVATAAYATTLFLYLLHSTQVTGDRARCSRAVSCHFSFASCAMAAFVVNVHVLYPCQCTEPHDVSFPLSCRLAYCLAMGFTGWVVTLRQAARRHNEGAICLVKRRWRSMHLAECLPVLALCRKGLYGLADRSGRAFTVVCLHLG